MPLYPYPPFSDEVTATGLISTTSSSPVLASGMTLTPDAGTYLVWFSANVEHSKNRSAVRLHVYAGGSEEAQRDVYCRDKNEPTQGSVQARVVVDGTQAIEGRYSRSAGTARMTDRSLMIKEVYDDG